MRGVAASVAASRPRPAPLARYQPTAAAAGTRVQRRRRPSIDVPAPCCHRVASWGTVRGKENDTGVTKGAMQNVMSGRWLFTEDAGLPYFDREAVIANGNWYYASALESMGATLCFRYCLENTGPSYK